MHELMHWIYQHPFFSELGEEIFALSADAAINDALKANPYAEFPEDGIDYQWMLDKALKAGFSKMPPAAKSDTMAYYEWLKKNNLTRPGSADGGSVNNSIANALRMVRR